jgi:hypothetical protein
MRGRRAMAQGVDASGGVGGGRGGIGYPPRPGFQLRRIDLPNAEPAPVFMAPVQPLLASFCTVFGVAVSHVSHGRCSRSTATFMRILLLRKQNVECAGSRGGWHAAAA